MSDFEYGNGFIVAIAHSEKALEELRSEEKNVLYKDDKGYIFLPSEYRLSKIEDSAKEIEKARRKQNNDLQALKEELDQKTQSLKDQQAMDEQKAIAEAKNHMAAEIAQIDLILANKKDQMAKELEKHQQNLEDNKRQLDLVYGAPYTYNESDFVSKGQRVSPMSTIMCYSPTPGSGTSTMALNTATLLASQGHKTMYIELDWQSPILKDTLGISLLNDNLDACFANIQGQNYIEIDHHIITKQKILNLKTEAHDMQARYPDMLNFMTYSPDSKTQTPMTIELLKGLLAYLKYKKRFEYVILDVPSYIDTNLLSGIAKLSSKHILNIPQDIVAMNALTKTKHLIGIDIADTALYVVNKYVDNTVLGIKKIQEGCRLSSVHFIPSLPNDMLLSAYRSIPAVLITQSRPLVSSYKVISDYLLKR
jgi:Mrp family chromosome partitioning ATPase